MTPTLPIALVRLRGGSVPEPGTMKETLSFMSREGFFLELDQGGASIWVFRGLFDPRKGCSVKSDKGLYSLIPLATATALFGYWHSDGKGGFSLQAEPPAKK